MSDSSHLVHEAVLVDPVPTSYRGYQRKIGYQNTVHLCLGDMVDHGDSLLWCVVQTFHHVLVWLYTVLAEYNDHD